MLYNRATSFAQRPIQCPGQIRLEFHEAVKRLNAKGADVAKLTGDSQAVADSVVKELGIDTVSAHVLPEEKAEKK